MNTINNSLSTPSGIDGEGPRLRLRELFLEHGIDPATEVIKLYGAVRDQRDRIVSAMDDDGMGGAVGVAKLTNESHKLMVTALKMLGEMEQKEIDQAIELQKMSDRKAENEPRAEQGVAYIPQYQTRRLADGREVVVAMPMVISAGPELVNSGAETGSENGILCGKSIDVSSEV